MRHDRCSALSAYLLAAFGLGPVLGCAETARPGPSGELVLIDEDTAVTTVDLLAKLPLCTPLLKGFVYYVSEEAKFYYCNGSVNKVLDVVGQQGAPGKSWLAVTASATAAQCPAGGTVVSTGPDTNGNSKLDANEVVSTGAACNGAKGAQGPQGAQGVQGPAGARGPQGSQGPAGTNGTNGEDGADGSDGTDGTDGATGPTGPQGANGEDGEDGPTGPAGTDGQDGEDGTDGSEGPTGPQGEDGVDGQDGTDGVDGTDALTTLIATAAAPVETCAAGGILVSTGLDLDDSGALDEDEVLQTQSVCNGAEGADGQDGADGTGSEVPVVRIEEEAAGDNCESGGNAVFVGLDTNGDGDLDDDEVTSVDYACYRTLQVVAAAAGGDHTCALLDNGSVKCWGNNGQGQLGLDDTTSRGDNVGELGNSLPPVSLGTGRIAIAIDTGTDHTCALLDNGSVKCWGSNGTGRLGLGDVASRGDNVGEMGDALPTVSLGTGHTALAIDGGERHTCALLDNGGVKCWGYNGQGQLGLGDTTQHGDNTGEMGDTLPAVSLGTGRTALAIDAGGSHTCALLDNGSVKCWGNNYSGQLGLGDTAYRGDNANEMGDDLATVNLGTGRAALTIDAGTNHTCALLDNRNVKCWGNNYYGQLGLGDTAYRGDNPGEMGDSLPAVDLGTGRTALAIDAGAIHTCALLDNGRVKCWGHNGYGQLGLGDTAYRGDNPGEMGDSLPGFDLGTGRTALTIDAGTNHTCALLDNAGVKCWGYNGYGQLGLGDFLARGDNANEMGDFLPFVSLF